MAKNVGKVFEDNWKKSIPKYMWNYKPPDAATGFNQTDKNLRFSHKSPSDYFIFDTRNGLFYTLELKSFEGACSFERTKEEKGKGTIHYYQIDTLLKFAEYDRVISGFCLDFRSSGNTYFLEIRDFKNMIDNCISKKSFNESDMWQYCKPYKIEKEKLRVHYRYNVELFCDDMKKKLLGN